MDATAKAREVLAGAVLAYLAAHPSAMDTPEGIAQWWVPGADAGLLTEALQDLERRGAIEAVRAGDAVCYRLGRGPPPPSPPPRPGQP